MLEHRRVLDDPGQLYPYGTAAMMFGVVRAGPSNPRDDNAYCESTEDQGSSTALVGRQTTSVDRLSNNLSDVALALWGRLLVLGLPELTLGGDLSLDVNFPHGTVSRTDEMKPSEPGQAKTRAHDSVTATNGGRSWQIWGATEDSRDLRRGRFCVASTAHGMR